jgi:hypothetical protein
MGNRRAQNRIYWVDYTTTSSEQFHPNAIETARIVSDGTSSRAELKARIVDMGRALNVEAITIHKVRSELID